MASAAEHPRHVVNLHPALRAQAHADSPVFEFGEIGDDLDGFDRAGNRNVFLRLRARDSEALEFHRAQGEPGEASPAVERHAAHQLAEQLYRARAVRFPEDRVCLPGARAEFDQARRPVQGALRRIREAELACVVDEARHQRAGDERVVERVAFLVQIIRYHLAHSGGGGVDDGGAIEVVFFPDVVIHDGQGKPAGRERRLDPAQAARLSRVEDEARIEALSPVLLREEIPSRSHQTLRIERCGEDGRLVLGDDGGLLADVPEVAAERKAREEAVAVGPDVGEKQEAIVLCEEIS